MCQETPRMQDFAPFTLQLMAAQIPSLNFQPRFDSRVFTRMLHGKNLTQWPWPMTLKITRFQILWRTKYVPSLIKIHWSMLILECSRAFNTFKSRRLFRKSRWRTATLWVALVSYRIIFWVIHFKKINKKLTVSYIDKTLIIYMCMYCANIKPLW
jgi:hypothetical protein